MCRKVAASTSSQSQLGLARERVKMIEFSCLMNLSYANNVSRHYQIRWILTNLSLTSMQRWVTSCLDSARNQNPFYKQHYPASQQFLSFTWSPFSLAAFKVVFKLTFNQLIRPTGFFMHLNADSVIVTV